MLCHSKTSFLLLHVINKVLSFLEDRRQGQPYRGAAEEGKRLQFKLFPAHSLTCNDL